MGGRTAINQAVARGAVANEVAALKAQIQALEERIAALERST